MGCRGYVALSGNDKKTYPDIPYILLGFSLGSFAVRTYLICYPGRIDGAILAGTGQNSIIELLIAKAITKR